MIVLHALETIERYSLSISSDGPITALLDKYGRAGWRLAGMTYTPLGDLLLVFYKVEGV